MCNFNTSRCMRLWFTIGMITASVHAKRLILDVSKKLRLNSFTAVFASVSFLRENHTSKQGTCCTCCTLCYENADEFLNPMKAKFLERPSFVFLRTTATTLGKKPAVKTLTRDAAWRLHTAVSDLTNGAEELFQPAIGRMLRQVLHNHARRHW